MAKKPKHNDEDYLRMYRQMVRIRTFEDNANQLYLDAKMPGLTHMYSGEAAVAVGVPARPESVERALEAVDVERARGQ